MKVNLKHPWWLENNFPVGEKNIFYVLLLFFNNGSNWNCPFFFSIFFFYSSRCCRFVWRRRTSFHTSPTCSRIQTWLCAWPYAITSLVQKSCLLASLTPSLQQGITRKLPKWQLMRLRYCKHAAIHFNRTRLKTLKTKQIISVRKTKRCL